MIMWGKNSDRIAAVVLAWLEKKLDKRKGHDKPPKGRDHRDGRDDDDDHDRKRHDHDRKRHD